VQNYAQQRRVEVGQRVRQTRRDKGWTQEQIADYLGCSRRRVNQAEQGSADLHLFELELLARKFDVPVLELINFSKQ